MNRFAPKLAEIAAKVAGLDETERAKLDAEMALDFNEHFQYQQLQAECHVLEVISTEEAQLIYIALGEVGSPSNGGWAAGTDLATKVLVTLAVGELLRARIAARRKATATV